MIPQAALLENSVWFEAYCGNADGHCDPGVICWESAALATAEDKRQSRYQTIVTPGPSQDQHVVRSRPTAVNPGRPLTVSLDPQRQLSLSKVSSAWGKHSTRVCPLILWAVAVMSPLCRRLRMIGTRAIQQSPGTSWVAADHDHCTIGRLPRC